MVCWDDYSVSTWEECGSWFWSVEYSRNAYSFKWVENVVTASITHWFHYCYHFCIHDTVITGRTLLKPPAVTVDLFSPSRCSFLLQGFDVCCFFVCCHFCLVHPHAGSLCLWVSWSPERCKTPSFPWRERSRSCLLLILYLALRWASWPFAFKLCLLGDAGVESQAASALSLTAHRSTEPIYI